MNAISSADECGGAYLQLYGIGGVIAARAHRLHDDIDEVALDTVLPDAPGALQVGKSCEDHK